MITIAKKRIKKVFDNSLANVVAGKQPNVSGEMIKAGYSESSSKALKVTQTKTWQQLLNKIDDQVILDRFYSILTDDDKRASMDAGKELLKLKDRYPASRSKIEGLFGGLGRNKDTV